MKSLKHRINESFNESGDSKKSNAENSLAKKLGLKDGDVTIINKDHIAVYSTSDKIKKEIEKNMPYKYLQTRDEKETNARMIFKHTGVNEAVETMGVDVLTKDVEKAKKALSKDFKVTAVDEINKTHSTIELAENPSKDNYARLKKAMGNIKWEHSLPF